MSTKRKRRQTPEESVNQNDNSSSLPEMVSAENAEPTSEIPEALSDEVVSNIQKKMFHAVKEMSRALKKARDFEVRKIIKRIKTAKCAILYCFLITRTVNESKKVLRLEKELQIAKVIISTKSNSFLVTRCLSVCRGVRIQDITLR
jgi:hypothetical protein